jgi:hypothetical protein
MEGAHIHLLSTEYEALLNGWDPLLLLHLLLDLRDLSKISIASWPRWTVKTRREKGADKSAYLVISLDVELNLLARQSADPVVIVRSVCAPSKAPQLT